MKCVTPFFYNRYRSLREGPNHLTALYWANFKGTVPCTVGHTYTSSQIHKRQRLCYTKAHEYPVTLTCNADIEADWIKLDVRKHAHEQEYGGAPSSNLFYFHPLVSFL